MQPYSGRKENCQPAIVPVMFAGRRERRVRLDFFPFIAGMLPAPFDRKVCFVRD